jgi:TPR repeat protein
MKALFQITVFIIYMMIGIYSNVQACGWWGDGQDDDDDVILVGDDGKPSVDDENSVDNPEMQTKIGNRFRKGEGEPRDYVKAVYWYRKAAQQGFAGAQNNLASMYEHGLGVPKNESEAARWYRKAAENGNKHAQHSIGSMYLEGRGVPQNFIESAKWFQKAAEQEHSGAFRDLGEMYWKGLGVSKNTVLAYMWLKLGSVYGDKASEKLLDMIAEQMIPSRISDAEKMVKDWMLKKK